MPIDRMFMGLSKYICNEKGNLAQKISKFKQKNEQLCIEADHAKDKLIP